MRQVHWTGGPAIRELLLSVQDLGLDVTDAGKVGLYSKAQVLRAATPKWLVYLMRTSRLLVVVPRANAPATPRPLSRNGLRQGLLQPPILETQARKGEPHASLSDLYSPAWNKFSVRSPISAICNPSATH